jgi:signal peptide peptidase SppA
MNNFDLASPLMMDPRYTSSVAMQARDAQELSALMFPTRTAADERSLAHGCLAVISVRGSLCRTGWRSYEWIERDLTEALQNDAVKGIVFDIDSPGGMVSGCMDLADMIFEARGQKPLMALANETCCSAAYAIASSCDEIVLTRTADVGSVGVVAMHVDMSAALERWGEKITLIHMGAHKIDGNPYEPLPAGVRERMEADLKTIYDLFTSTVARNRSMSVESVVATEALVYMGEKAVEVGFADRVQSPREALATFASQFNTNFLGALNMKITASDFKDRLNKLGISDKDLTAAFADVNLAEGEIEIDDVQASTSAESESPADAESAATSASDEKQRIHAIVGSDLATGRTELANHLAFETDMSAEAALKTLEASPEKKTDPLSDAMSLISQPDLAGDGGDDDIAATATGWEQSLKRTGASFRR